MKPIDKTELYEHVSGFLKDKGIELKSGSYVSGIQAGCSLLADAINLSQQGISRARAGLDTKLEQMRQVIHEKTAPPAAPKAAPGAAAPPPSPGPTGAKKKSPSRKSKKTKRARS